MKLADILMEQPQHQEQLEVVASRIVQWLQTVPQENFPMSVKGAQLPKGVLGAGYARLRNMTWTFALSNEHRDGAYWPAGDELSVYLQSMGGRVKWEDVTSTIVHELRHKFDSSISKKPGAMWGSKFMDNRPGVPYIEQKHEINARYAQTIAATNAKFNETPDMTMLQYIQTFEKFAAKNRLIDIFKTEVDSTGSDFMGFATTGQGEEKVFGRESPGLLAMLYDNKSGKSRLQGPIDNPQYKALIKRAAKNYQYLADKRNKAKK